LIIKIEYVFIYITYYEFNYFIIILFQMSIDKKKNNTLLAFKKCLVLNWHTWSINQNMDRLTRPIRRFRKPINKLCGINIWISVFTALEGTVSYPIKEMIKSSTALFTKIITNIEPIDVRTVSVPPDIIPKYITEYLWKAHLRVDEGIQMAIKDIPSETNYLININGLLDAKVRQLDQLVACFYIHSVWEICQLLTLSSSQRDKLTLMITFHKDTRDLRSPVTEDLISLPRVLYMIVREYDQPISRELLITQLLDEQQ